MDVLGQIERWARLAPDRVAHVSGARRVSYAELLRRADAVAAHLAATLGGDRSPVVVLGHKEPELLAAFLGAARAGHPYVPVDTGLPEARIRRTTELSGARITLTPEAVAALPDAAPPPADARVRGDAPYYILFTSGSTGEPKGVVITHACLATFVEWMLGEHPLAEAAETYLNQAPFSFDLSVMDLYLSLVTGGTLFSLTRDDVANPKALYAALGRSDASVWVSTPSFAQLCLAEKTFSEPMLPRVRRFLFCGETLPPAVAAALLDRFPSAQVWNTYGPTEATVACTSINVDRAVLERYNPLPVGCPMPQDRIEVLDEAGDSMPEGERGEIVIAGPNVSTGYLGRPDLNARAFTIRHGLRAYRTGDWGRYRDGLLFFEGRMDSQVKLHGYRIELGDVEANLRALPAVRDAVVIPVVRDGAVESLAAFVTLAAPPTAGESEFETAAGLRAALGERIPSYMHPRKFYFLDALPMTPNGKADRQAMAASLR